MEIENLTEILRQHPFVTGLCDQYMEVLVGCATNVRFQEGTVIIREGETANKFYLIRSGRVALEINASGRPPLRIQTTGPGEILGWSWLVSPHRWHFDGVAVAETKAISLDAECMRNKCENDVGFGYEILKRLSQVIEQRLEATRLQLLDFYAEPMTGVGP